MKKILSWLLVMSLLVGMTGTTFAGIRDVKGYTMINPMGLNSELKITDLKTANGAWKSASIKVSEVQIDNAGYKKLNSLQSVKYSDTTLRKYDAVKVKVTYTFSGFTGNNNSLIKNNLLADEINAVDSNGIFLTDGQFYSGFANGLYNKVEKYTLGGKTYKGEWYGKKIKDVNFSKSVSMSGYVYLIMDKGTTKGAFVNFVFSENNNIDKGEAYFVFSNKELESRIKKTGTYIYGDESVGVIKANFDMTYIPDEEESLDDGVALKYYRLGTEEDPIIELCLIKSVDGFTEKNLKRAIEDYADEMAKYYDLETKVENGIYVVQGISSVSYEYVSYHFISKGDYFNVVKIISDPKEKDNANKLWESYKANNDLSPAKATSTLSSYIYGTKEYGTFISTEKMKDITKPNDSLFQYQGKDGDWLVSMNIGTYDKAFVDNFEAKSGLDKIICQHVKLDNGNMNVYSNTDNPQDNYIVLLTVKNNNVYFLSIDAFKNKMTEVKIPVIKSYLLSIGYTESEVNVILSDGIFK